MAAKRGRVQNLAAESLREQQMKLREEREARRATMDGRHEYVLSTVADRLQMSMEDAEEFMLDGDQLKDFDSFFAPGGRPSLLFYYLPPQEGEEGKSEKSKGLAYNANGRRLWITDGTQDEFTGTCLFFLRFNIQKPITMVNIHQVCLHIAVQNGAQSFVSAFPLHPAGGVLWYTGIKWGGAARGN